MPAIAAGDFTADFSVMEQLKDLAASGTGLIGVLLPDTTTSTRYVQYDKPFLTKAFETAGLSADQFKIDNAQGSTTTMQTQAEADINAGASVLLIDPLDPASGAAIEQNAESKGVKVIDYDRLVTGGPADRYYVSFNNVQVGQLIGQGEVSCISAWNVKNPNTPDHGRRPQRQQREAVRAGLQRGPEAALQRRVLHEGRGACGHVDARGRGHELPAAVHGAPEHQRGRDAERRQRERGDRRAAGPEDPGEHVPDHRSGRVDRRACRTS